MGHGRGPVETVVGGLQQVDPGLTGKNVVETLKTLWKVSGMPCGKRLKAVVPEWLDHYERRNGELVADLRHKVLAIKPCADQLAAHARPVTGRKGPGPWPQEGYCDSSRCFGACGDLVGGRARMAGGQYGGAAQGIDGTGALSGRLQRRISGVTGRDCERCGTEANMG